MTKLNSVSFQDKVEIPSQRTYTDSGQLIVPCAFARTGSMQYTRAQVGLTDGDPMELVDVFREETEVFAEDSMNSFRSVPVTIMHPTDEQGNAVSVSASNAKELQVGVLEGVPVRNEDTLTGTLVIARQDAIDIINDGTVELSAGYTCNLEMTDGKIFQTNIKANHIAIVERGRAGSAFRIADSVTEPNEEINMTDKVETKIEDKQIVADAALVLELNDTKTLLTDAEAKVVELTAKLDVSDEALKELTDSLDSLIEARSALLSDAARFSDADFKGKTTEEVVLACVSAKYPDLAVADKSVDYLQARFDLMCEDKSSESLTAAVADSLSAVEKPAVDIVADARARMLARNSK